MTRLAVAAGASWARRWRHESAIAVPRDRWQGALDDLLDELAPETVLADVQRVWRVRRSARDRWRRPARPLNAAVC